MIQDHLTNPELSQQLKELGVPQGSEFYWVKQGEEWVIKPRQDVPFEFLENCSAFLASELGEIIPGEVQEEEKEYSLEIGKCSNGWSCLYAYSRYDDYEPTTLELLKNNGDGTFATDKSEANARAKMLIYLIQQGLVSFTKKKGEGRE